MELHKLLLRQCNRLGINITKGPANLDEWTLLLNRISNAYSEIDQERYLLERSMEVSSKEMQELNQKLEKAQKSARMGYWSFNLQNSSFILSKGLIEIINLKTHSSKISLEDFNKITHPDDTEKLNKFINDRCKENIPDPIEIRLPKEENQYNWYRISYNEENFFEENSQNFLNGILMDITWYKNTEEKISLLNQQLLTAARRAGMADVATAILHNVGNILNSANVSLELILESLENQHCKNFFSIINLLKENSNDIINYLTSNEKGRKIPQFILNISPFLMENHQTISKESQNLSEQLLHIKNIVKMQQPLGGMSGFSEKIFLKDVIEEAIQMSGVNLNSKIKLIKDFKISPSLCIDKTKLMQILLNLIQNARDAVKLNTFQENKQIIICLDKYKDQADKILLQVIDNGIGITEEIMKKIFTFGFTTKVTGHGFGLHSSALAAKEIGGLLWPESFGANQGATFNLVLNLTSSP